MMAWIEPAVLCLLAAMMCAGFLLILIAFALIRRKPRDWMPCEAWIACGIVAAAWALKVLV